MSLADKYNFKKFIQRIYVNALPGEIYDMITKGELLEKWYVKKASYHTEGGEQRKKEENILKNDEYLWEWIDGSLLNGRIIEVESNKSIKFTFGKGVTVNIILNQIGGKTLIELMQEQDITEYESRFESYMACFPGWYFYLINLKSVCEGGLDLREENPDTDMLVNI